MFQHEVGERYDAVVVGASLAGCSAATLLARRGARVALIERRPDLSDYKRTCTHFIQAGATPTIQRLGLAERIEAAGGLRNGIELWTRYGWVRPQLDDDSPYPSYGYSIRREKLDPIVRELARDAGAELLLGQTVVDLLKTNGRIEGAVVEGRDRERRELRAHVVVGADGRGSRVAKLAGVRGRVRPHNRFAYFAYFRDLPARSGPRAMLWFLDPDGCAVFPNDDGVTLIAAMPTKDKLPEFKRDPEAAVLRYYDRLADAPDPRTGTRISPWTGKLDMPNVSRAAAAPGIAFVGDAAMACDPLWGVGCGFAFQSGEWLADAIGDALLDTGDVDSALDRYRRHHRRMLAGHHWMMCDYATGRPFTAVEKLLFSSAAIDDETARLFHAIGSRSVPFQDPIGARLLARALQVALRSRRRQSSTTHPAVPALPA
jgi:menaquinone-9 beta-reductase